MDDELRRLLTRIEDQKHRVLMAVANAGEAFYIPQTAIEQVFIYQFQTAGYVEITPLETFPGYSNLVLSFGARLTPEGRRYTDDLPK